MPSSPAPEAGWEEEGLPSTATPRLSSALEKHVDLATLVLRERPGICVSHLRKGLLAVDVFNIMVSNQLIRVGWFDSLVDHLFQGGSPLDRLDASFLELADSIRAAQIAEESEDHVKYEFNMHKKRVWCEGNQEPRKKGRPRTRTEYAKRAPIGKHEIAALSLPKPMVGFGLPTDPWRVTQRKLPEGALGPPFFYYENVALAPKGVWETFSRFLYDIEPEFVDSKHFSAAARKRGYVHNLPVDDRFPLLPIPPLTIHEALPSTKKWWPSWDKRTKLNCLQTVTASARLTERIRSALVNSGDPPPPHEQRFVLDECRKWNLVWVGLHKVAPLEPDEVEMLLGFPKNHTRGGGISRTERYKSLGNSFQVDTVAYHLSVLRDLFPCGIRVLSLFSGIGGAEVALHRLGVPLNVVVSVEISEVNRNIVRGWWEQTEQKGTLIDIADVQQVNEERLKQLINKYGGFDLVIGGSPCNNLAGSNRSEKLYGFSLVNFTLLPRLAIRVQSIGEGVPCSSSETPPPLSLSPDVGRRFDVVAIYNQLLPSPPVAGVVCQKVVLPSCR
ncbi:hypothetical protein Taro_051707 [Colocasia esculenta]|uniref:DNA (cytosine-5-)-methyltransferase n=1 Tax=Colocasia esculenta TaxID=4460 RepID=A0A843XHJ0_COLES|nr:hypothetical protein [Colocasia esculenta]